MLPPLPSKARPAPRRAALLGAALSCALAALAACSSAPADDGAVAPRPPEEWERVDLYGSQALDRDELWRRCGSLLIRCLQLARREPSLAAEEVTRRDEERLLLEREITTRLLGVHDFALIKVSAITYFRPGWPCYVTVDLVDADEADRRMPFRLVEGPALEDPGGVLALWQEYETLCWQLLAEGELQPSRVEGPAFHYTFGFQHPRLTRFEEPLTTLVRGNEAALTRVLLESGDPGQRAAAAFALAHSRDGDAVVAAMQAAMDDAAFLVRNNAMRVLADIARRSPEVDIPLGPMVAALDWATTTDRNKAAATVASLVDREGAAEVVLRDAGPVLLRLLALRQPNNRDYAHEILRKCCQVDWPVDDFEHWRQEVQAAR